MASDKITVTGVTGPAVSLTATIFNDVKSLEFDTEHQSLKIVYGIKTTHIDLYTIATITYTVATHVATVTISS